jgi:hypothetical protein
MRRIFALEAVMGTSSELALTFTSCLTAMVHPEFHCFSTLPSHLCIMGSAAGFGFHVTVTVTLPHPSFNLLPNSYRPPLLCTQRLGLDLQTQLPEPSTDSA